MPTDVTASSAWNHDYLCPRSTINGPGSHKRGPLDQNHSKYDSVPKIMRKADRTILEHSKTIFTKQRTI